MHWKINPISKLISNLNERVTALNNKFTNLGTFSASTESDFFTEVVNQIKTYANGTYVFSAAWQYTSIYIITANKVSNTRIIGSAVPQMQNGKDMVGFSYEGTTLNLYPLVQKSKINFDFIHANHNLTTFSLELDHNATNGFRTGLVITSDASHPGLWLISFGTGENPTTVGFFNIYKDNSDTTPLMTAASLSGTTLTLAFDRTAYGGLRVIWLN